MIVEPWLIMGDYNSPLAIQDKEGGEPVSCKLDRAMVNSQWLVADYESYVEFTPPDLVANTWEAPVYGNAQFTLKIKLTRLKGKLSLLGEARQSSPIDVSSLHGTKLSQAQASSLKAAITEEEIKKTLFSIGTDKAPGLDGYNAKFFMAAWDNIGADFIEVIREFFTNGQLLKQWNHTLIALIPKSDHAPKVMDFRPISCCTIFYKVISKLLVARIENVMDILLDPAQVVFIKANYLISAANMKMIEWFAGENKGSALAYEFFRPKAAKVDWFSVIWKPYILPKHRFTSWLLAHGRLRMADTISYESNKLCTLCHQQGESNNHIFFDREIVKPLLDKVKTWMGITFDITNMTSFLDTFRQHYKGKGRQMKARHLA
ncbi:uncharacterized protein LOC122050697 [Zingiber officinale]|uniref:uncharacterized protein LOC122050697 n=1 Tax=Zingiber officinale TaxID=94328 RepID=UPI001C4C8558|nr:uncharacterized protein LOC122050697 [Zingiber officinale]